MCVDPNLGDIAVPVGLKKGTDVANPSAWEIVAGEHACDQISVYVQIGKSPRHVELLQLVPVFARMEVAASDQIAVHVAMDLAGRLVKMICVQGHVSRRYPTHSAKAS